MPSGRRDEQSAEQIERRLANRDLAKAHKAMKSVRTLLFTFAAILALITAFVAVATFGGNASSDARITLVVATLFYAALTVLVFIAGVRVSKEPLLWTLLAALGATVISLPLLFTDSFVLIAIATIATIGLWGAVFAIVPASRLLREHPDLKAAQRIRGERPARGEVGDASKRAYAKTQAKRRKTMIAVGVGAGAVALFGGVMYFLNKPQKIEDVVTDIRTALENRRVDEVADLADPDGKDDLAAKIKRVLQRRNWHRVRAKISDVSIKHPKPEQARVIFETAKGRLSTNMRVNGGRWRITGLSFRKS